MIADGALGVEGKAFMRVLSEKIAATWHKSNSEVMGYVRARLMLLSFVLQICAFVGVG